MLQTCELGSWAGGGRQLTTRYSADIDNLTRNKCVWQQDRVRGELTLVLSAVLKRRELVGRLVGTASLSKCSACGVPLDFPPVGPCNG